MILTRNYAVSFFFFIKRMSDHILKFTEKLITFHSFRENEKELNVILSFALSHLKNFSIKHFERNGIKSALVYNTKKIPERFRLLLNVHLDVIPAKEYQFTPVRKGNRLYGAGSMDMKAGVACALTAFGAMANNISYPLGLQLVTDEEVGGFHGTKYQVEEGIRSDFVLACEPTNFDIVHKAKGILMIRVHARGKTAHGAYPWRGTNALWMMHAFLKELEKHFPIPKKEVWATTCNVSFMETSNRAFNKIPDDCSVSLDIRYIPDEKESTIRKIRSLLGENMSLEILEDEPALYTDPKNTSLLKLKTITEQLLGKKGVLRGAHGSSDARHFARSGCPGIEFGPIGGGIGSDKEWVDIGSLEIYTSILKEFMRSLEM